jgi:mannose-1-phosphate guanylyltransferase/mannose-6-phosphate isomerase
MKFIPVIMSGGAGTRLWPVSRELHPKPFIRMSDGQSLLQKTFLRAAELPDVNEILTVTNRDLYFKTEDEYRAVNVGNLPTSYVLEPNGRNTAPAIAAAALHATELYGADAVLLVLSADHLVSNKKAFQEAVARAKLLAEQGMLVTFGIQPCTPETGYGYIEADGNKVMRFVEKPSLDKAKEYLASGKYLWNAGIFCFRADVVLAELTRYAPELVANSKACYQASRSTRGKGFTQIELNVESFQKVPDISIDYALMEKSDNVGVVACDIGWSDIGSWSAISELEVADDNGNRVVGEAMMYDTTGCFIQSRDRVIGTVGVENLIIIDTPDALLVANKDRAQDVKQIVGLLKQQGHEAYKMHKQVFRPWGSYTVLEEGARFKIKRLEVKPGGKLSLQMHHHRSEHWVVVSGMAKVTNDVQETFVNTNESTYIPAGHKHCVENEGVVDLVMIEVQSGEYLGEDDIVRFEDKYGRAPQ